MFRCRRVRSTCRREALRIRRALELASTRGIRAPSARVASDTAYENSLRGLTASSSGGSRLPAKLTACLSVRFVFMSRCASDCWSTGPRTPCLHSIGPQAATLQSLTPRATIPRKFPRRAKWASCTRARPRGTRAAAKSRRVCAHALPEWLPRCRASQTAAGIGLRVPAGCNRRCTCPPHRNV